jgi:biopolymer transport protein ExbD
MNFGSDGRDGDGPGIDITPLVDMVFLLHIFFLLTWTFVNNPNIPIRLPQASVHQTTAVKRDLMIGITSEGELRLEGKAIDTGRLQVEMRRIFADAPESMVLIQADRMSRHGKVVQVMDMAKQIGFERIGIAIESAPEARHEDRTNTP